MSDILDKIVAVKRDEIRASRAHRDLASLRRDAESLGGQRDFVASVRSKIAAWLRCAAILLRTLATKSR
jgi:indole-3-glycerol phosphate synthase